jgi:hypothetical protein
MSNTLFEVEIGLSGDSMSARKQTGFAIVGGGFQSNTVMDGSVFGKWGTYAEELPVPNRWHCWVETRFRKPGGSMGSPAAAFARRPCTPRSSGHESVDCEAADRRGWWCRVARRDVAGGFQNSSPRPQAAPFGNSRACRLGVHLDVRTHPPEQQVP